MLTLATPRLCGYRGDRHVELAAAVEFIHTATLLHDDVVDESGLRRGQATANAVWGNKPTVLVGDFLFSRAFELMVEDGSLRVLEILSRASAVIAEGEVLQLDDLQRHDHRRRRLSRGHRRQDGGAVRRRVPDRRGRSASARTRKRRRSTPIGRNLGIAFQLVDDMLDYSARKPRWARSVGDDFREGKITLPVVLAYRAATKPSARSGAARWRIRISATAIWHRAIELMNRHDCLFATWNRANHYGELARRRLGRCSATVPRSARSWRRSISALPVGIEAA